MNSFDSEKPTKDIPLFSAVFSRCIPGFYFGSKVIYTVLGINCFLFSFSNFLLSKIFRVYVARFVHLYLRKLESYPFDFHS